MHGQQNITKFKSSSRVINNANKVTVQDFFFPMDLRFSSQIVTIIVFLSYANECEGAACTKRLSLPVVSCPSCHS
jgi:hypothetical protein